MEHTVANPNDKSEGKVEVADPEPKTKKEKALKHYADMIKRLDQFHEEGKVRRKAMQEEMSKFEMAMKNIEKNLQEAREIKAYLERSLK
jgi:butyrate kinase